MTTDDYDATFTGASPSYTASTSTVGGYFSGQAGEAWEIGNSSGAGPYQLNTTDSRTVQMWVRFNDVSVTNELWDKDGALYGWDGVNIVATSSGALQVRTNGTSILKNSTSATGVVTTGEW